jgi:hypothetical protein
MKITRISGQSRKTLLEDYAPRDSDGAGKQVVFRGMQDLLRRLQTADGPALHAFTSIFTLCFVDGDDHRLPVIAACEPQYAFTEADGYLPCFNISYPPSQSLQRSPEDWVCWTTHNVDEAVQMVLMAIRRSAFSPDLD